MKSFGTLSLVTIALFVLLLNLADMQAQTQHRLTIGDGKFLLDGKQFQIISGEMHYARIPREYWRARLKMARAMGLNTVSTYVFWNLHEPEPGRYDFSGQLDVAEFIREAQQEGLFVILRPGPYVCAEWDLGGLPAWLLADPKMVLRSDDLTFMQPAQRWLTRLGKELAPLQAPRGGPIIAVQVENEYGSFDSDRQYMKHVYDLIAESGFKDSLLYTADGPEQLPNGTLPGVPAVVNFGPGETKEAFAALANMRPGQPMMAGEYWAGWFDYWGGKHAQTDTAQQVADLKWMLDRGYSVNLYMFHGGTTFGFMNGANLDKEYRPQTTSYDYDAALDESGRPTKKYFAFRDVISASTGTKPPDVPKMPRLIGVEFFAVDGHASLWDNLGRVIDSQELETMESLGQSYGYILYRTNIEAKTAGELQLDGMYDYAQVYVNRQLQGTLDRRLGQTTLKIEVPAQSTLDILVENGGRVNFKKDLRNQRKGIAGPVTLAGTPLKTWAIFSLPMSDVGKVRFSGDRSYNFLNPGFLRGTFILSETGDTYLNVRDLGKGVVWINGHLLGRFWNIGPQQSLYVPAPWLKVGRNEVVVFNLNDIRARTLQGLVRPLYAK